MTSSEIIYGSLKTPHRIDILLRLVMLNLTCIMCLSIMEFCLTPNHLIGCVCMSLISRLVIHLMGFSNPRYTESEVRF
ncbi:hypothetical protein BJX64DRAFT_260861, partial [Aspergillus heterothallicus]